MAPCRQLLGYDRVEKPELVAAINDRYKNAFSLYANYFCSSRKLKEKQRVNLKQIKKDYPAQTPYQRLLDSEQLTQQAKLLLRETHKSLNSFKLNKIIESKLKMVFNTLWLPQPCCRFVYSITSPLWGLPFSVSQRVCAHRSFKEKQLKLHDNNVLGYEYLSNHPRLRYSIRLKIGKK